jgi:hypothetical protein
MAAPFHSIKRKAEDAVAAIINSLKVTGQLAGVTAFKGFSGSALTVPRYEVVATEAEAEVVGATVTGNMTVTVTVTMISQADDTTRATHQANAAAIEDILMRDDVAAQLNSASVTEFKAFSWYPVRSVDSVVDDTLRTAFTGTLYGAVL